MRPRCARRINPFTRLPGSIPTPPGLERYILRKIPIALPAGAVVILVPSAALRLAPWGMNPQELIVVISRVDMFALGMLLLYFNLMVALAWGALIVMVMKGPAYVADSYPLVDADSPADTPLPLGLPPDGQPEFQATAYPGPNVFACMHFWRWRAHPAPRRHSCNRLHAVAPFAGRARRAAQEGFQPAQQMSRACKHPRQRP